MLTDNVFIPGASLFVGVLQYSGSGGWKQCDTALCYSSVKQLCKSSWRADSGYSEPRHSFMKTLHGIVLRGQIYETIVYGRFMNRFHE